MTMIEKVTCKTAIRPLRTTFATARGTKNNIVSIMVTALCSDGSIGMGEVPTSFGIPQETPEVIIRHVRRASKWLCGENIEEWPSLKTHLERVIPDLHMTCSGIETALFRAWLASTGSDEKTWWGRRKTRAITTDITIPFADDAETLRPWVERAIHYGFKTYKIKVSGDVRKDAKFVHSIAKMLDEEEQSYTIRLDGNQGFTCDSAMRLLNRLKVDIELFEQPLKHDDYKEMKKLTTKAPLPIIADETVFSVEDCRRVIEDELAHGINIKIAKSGIAQSKEIIKLAKKAKLKLMIGCMTETIVGLSAAIYCAAGSGAFDYIDLDSVHFLYAHYHHRNITIDGAMYHLGDGV